MNLIHFSISVLLSILLENGFSEYFEWHDDKSWYPNGRNISQNSQVMLHTTAAITYQIFGGNSSLYDYTILFPAVIGSLTVVVIFALVRLFGGTSCRSYCIFVICSIFSNTFTRNYWLV